MIKQPLFVRQDGVLKKINSDEIILLEASGNYVKFYMAGSYLMARTTLDTALSQLPANQFLKVHRSFAASVHHIVEIARDFLILAGLELAVPVSKQYYPEFTEQITIIGSGSPDQKD